MIPFLEHDDANRALMGSNMQKQATPCVVPEAPFVATGIEARAARDTGRLIIRRRGGEVTHADAQARSSSRTKTARNTNTLSSISCAPTASRRFHQRPLVSVGDKVKKGDVLADTSTSDNGQLALGQNVLVAFMSWSGANYEDAIIISERLVERREVHLYPHRRVRLQRARHEARSRSDDPRHSERF